MLVRRIVAKCPLPMVIDADGLNALSSDPASLAKCKGRAILTPHPGEMARLAGISNSERWRVTPWDESQLPAVTIRDTQDDIEPELCQQAYHRLIVELEVFATAATTAATLAALETAAGTVHAAFLARTRATDEYGTYLQADSQELQQGDQPVGARLLRYSVEYRTAVNAF